MDVNSFLHYITSLPDYQGQIEYIQYLPSSEPTLAEIIHLLHPDLESALKAAGVETFFSHQAKAIDAALSGNNVMVSTSSASGKTICYNVPVLQALLEDRSTRALYLFPTKALAQDQLRGLAELSKGLLTAGEFATFDGDTPQIGRSQIKKKAKIVLSNPDMLHIGILPNHKTWSNFIACLKYVVIDEAHVYRGVFGSHVANIVRRLKRICSLYGSSPRFILCSATTGNPLEHAQKLVGEDFVLVDREGAPHGRKSFVFWNPPLTDLEKSSRRSPNSEATLLFTELVKKGIRSLVFARSRKLTELIYVYSRDHLSPDLAERIKAYRAGYLAEDRRQIEQDLFSGVLLGAVSTNALELGIDIGDLEATIITGYPGSIASTWQQAGRSGRSGGGGLSVLIGDSNPLDQYLMNHPDFFFGHAYEDALLNWENINILKDHLLCAAWEKPLTKSDQLYFGNGMFAVLDELQHEGKVRQHRYLWHLSPRLSHPAQGISIRSASANNYAVLDASRAYQVIETVQESNAFFQLHDGAVYLHQGETYFIKKLDLEKKIALVEPISVPYYTQAKDITDITILKILQQKHLGRVEINFGEVEVTTRVLGFRKKMQFTEEVIGDETLDLPPLKFMTQALWFDLAHPSISAIVEGKLDFAGGLHAAEHASISLLPLFALCDRNDIGGVSTPFHPDTGKPQIFIYDACPGGIGIAEKGYHIIVELWQATCNIIQQCPCIEGCPSCIQSPKCGNNNEPLDKKAGLLLIQGLLQEASAGIE